jgi:hypothetical protein
MKHILLLRASSDVCQVEVDQIQTIAKMHGMEPVLHTVAGADSLARLADCHVQFDYIYLATHANPEGFGDDGTPGYFVPWYQFAHVICPMDILTHSSVFLLACCRGGVEQVSFDILAGCDKAQFVCGPRWKLAAPDLTAGFHAFIYNMECRRLQPDQAAKRASDATGYDFLCYDRIDIERRPEFKEHQERIWGLLDVAEMSTEPGAAPNGGPATPSGNSGVTEGPPSVS